MVILPDGYLAFVFSPLHLLFGLGIIVGWVIRKQWVRNNLWIVAGGLSVFMFNTALTIVAHRHETVWLRIAGDVGLAVSIWAAMGIELSRNLKFPSTLKFLGDASYSIYLIHFLVITEFAKELYALDRNLFVPVSAILFLLFSAALLSGIALHMGVEIPLLRLLSRKKHPEEQLDPLAIPVAYPAFGMPE
jgi:peptidoglycan/LPS O-acetylase OafA/YrhL